MPSPRRNLTDMPPLTRLYEEKRSELGERGKPLSHRAAAERAGDPGKYETFRLIGTGQHSGKIDEETVAALAALGIPVRAIRVAAGHQLADTPGPFELPARANRLTRPQREVVLSVVDAILSAAEGHRAAEQPLRAVASGRTGRRVEAAEEASRKAREARENG